MLILDFQKIPSLKRCVKKTNCLKVLLQCCKSTVKQWCKDLHGYFTAILFHACAEVKTNMVSVAYFVESLTKKRKLGGRLSPDVQHYLGMDILNNKAIHSAS